MHSNAKVFAAACAGLMLFGMAMLSLGTVNTYLAGRFHLDAMGVGSLAALLPFGILAGSLLFGPVVDRFGYKLPLAAATFFLSAGLLLIAQAASFLPVQGAFFVIGFGGGVLNGGTNALVADISGEKRGARLSLLGVFYGVGALGMPALTAICLRVASHAAIITGFAAAMILPLAYVLAIRFPAPKQSQGFPIAGALALIRDRALVLLSMVLFFESAAEGLVNNWSPAFLQRAQNIDGNSSLLMLTVLAASLTIARLILGWALTKIRSQEILFICLGSAILGALLLYVATNTATVIAAMVLIGIGFSAVFPVLFAYLGELFPTLSGTAFGIALVIALSGNTLVNYALGGAAQLWGIGILPGYLTADLVCVGVFLLLGLKAYSHRQSSTGS
jgi:MFS transporter, FHS family, glucose/mannose:H+ symporter